MVIILGPVGASLKATGSTQTGWSRSSAEVMRHLAQMTPSASNRLTRTKTNLTLLPSVDGPLEVGEPLVSVAGVVDHMEVWRRR